MSRRVSLPGASELFGGAAPKQTRPEKRTTPDGSASADRPSPNGRSRTAVVDDRKSSGRIRHDTKITVYVTEEELIGLEKTRLALREEHGLNADRGRIVREAIDVLLADFVDHGPDSLLVQRLRAANEPAVAAGERVVAE
ncbi:hypothetical protein EV643_102198 [Kribbella sp. VKM Ac-2527]|uniref:Uncharacterized protein n=1 Tax=Kribbella caucasensis TaxID=2512215 RepID=A0A4R6KPU9_9ACTN|nr:hypothetical protein [Kribbella sp. VKM Ac-2527]TDO52360.1 hypothetical protein EV643_102198 [Kribbella sp. VKM Ac-2527]